MIGVSVKLRELEFERRVTGTCGGVGSSAKRIEGKGYQVLDQKVELGLTCGSLYYIICFLIAVWY